MKLLCVALLVLLGHQALTKPRKMEHQPSIIKPGEEENPKGFSEFVKGKPIVFTGKPWVIEPWNENAALLDHQTLLNPKFEQMLVKLKSMPTGITEAGKGKPKVTTGKPKVTTGKPKVTTGKPWFIEPWNEDTAFLDRQTQLNPKMEQMLHKLKSMPVENLKDQVEISQETGKRESRQGCGGEYTTSNGVISHPLDGGSYGNHENCIWKIQAAEPIKITFVRFGLELNYDFLYLRDGESSASSLLGKFTGDNLPMSVEPSQNTAFIRFTSDYSMTSKGFELRWEPSPKVTTCQCGMANTERIIGGTEVNPKYKYPWQIGLKNPGYLIGCGGTIINDRWILTAAHCITDRKTCRLNNNAGLKVLVGEHNQFDGNDDATDTTKYSIKTFIKHPNYNCDTLDYDFALLELTEAIPFNSVIRPICLPEDDSETYAGQTGIVTGWGLTTDFTVKGTGSDFLNEVQVSIFANDDCKNWNPLADMKICASVGSCKGDSGGPMHVIKDGKFVQVGVVSYGSGSGCTAPGFPAVYARVSKVLPWISTTTSNGKKCD